MDKGVPALNGADAPSSVGKEKYSDAKKKVDAPAKSLKSPPPDSDGVGLPLSMMNNHRRKASTGGDGSNTNGGGSGNNSDNSGIISLGNNSFGFNFDSEEAMLNNSPRSSEVEGKTGESDSDGNAAAEGKSATSGTSKVGTSKSGDLVLLQSSSSGVQREKNSGTSSTLHSHASPKKAQVSPSKDGKNPAVPTRPPAMKQEKSKVHNLSGKKRRVEGKVDSDSDSGGYSSDVEEGPTTSRTSTGDNSKMPDNAVSSSRVNDTNSRSLSKGASSASGQKHKGKKSKLLDEQKREERNAREKERSFRISRQINELRNLLSSGGVIVPKGTKSSVLTEAANYIRMLQQHQYRSEIDRHQLIQQVQMIGGGALGPQAATAVRHVAAQNGVWSLGNFGGVPPRSAMSFYHQETEGAANSCGDSKEQKPNGETVLVTSIDEHEYRFVFNSCAVGMAIASMGGAFIDCNELFCMLSDYTKQEVCSMTIFNLTSRQDLQHAFDLISQMISPPSDGRMQSGPKTCTLRGSMKNRDDLGLSVSLIKGDDGIAKCFCVTLVNSPASSFDSGRPVPATADLIQKPAETVVPAPKPVASGALNGSPAYTAG